MKTIRFLCLSLFSSLLSFVWTNQAPDVAQTDVPIQTDKREYQATYDPSSMLLSNDKQGAITYRPMAFKVKINISYTNRTGITVYIPTCQGRFRPNLEKKVKGKWVVAYGPGGRLCRGAPVRIEPGETYRDTFKVEAFWPRHNSNLDFFDEEIEGTYRLVYDLHDIYIFPMGREPDRLLPLEERISNEFRLIRQPYPYAKSPLR